MDAVMDDEQAQLKQAIERRHGGTATIAQSVPVRETVGKATWEGVVHVFDLVGHPTANRAYAWSTFERSVWNSVEGEGRRLFFAVLHEPPVASPAEAIRVALAAEPPRK